MAKTEFERYRARVTVDELREKLIYCKILFNEFLFRFSYELVYCRISMKSEKTNFVTKWFVCRPSAEDIWQGDMSKN